jgi:hypothetical protein
MCACTHFSPSRQHSHYDRTASPRRLFCLFLIADRYLYGDDKVDIYLMTGLGPLPGLSGVIIYKRSAEVETPEALAELKLVDDRTGLKIMKSFHEDVSRYLRQVFLSNDNPQCRGSRSNPNHICSINKSIRTLFKHPGCKALFKNVQITDTEITGFVLAMAMSHNINCYNTFGKLLLRTHRLAHDDDDDSRTSEERIDAARELMILIKSKITRYSILVSQP